MKFRRLFMACLAATHLVAMTGCVSTLFFPKKAAEKAADKVIGDIWPELSAVEKTRTEDRKS